MLYPVVPGARPCRSRGRAAARGGTMSAEGQPAIFLGRSETSETLPLKFANRHGLIAGATGTGKTVTLQIMAEGFSPAGVPVFLADVKGDQIGRASCREGEWQSG